MRVGAEIVTVTDRVTVPPGPVQSSVYVLLAVRLPVDSELLTVFAPVHPFDAVQLVVLVDDHVSVEAVL